jgi:hypothetical protein
MIQRSEISPQLVAILVFRGNVTMLLPFGARYPQDKSVRAADMPKTSTQGAPSVPLPVLENFWPAKHTNNMNDEELKPANHAN